MLGLATAVAVVGVASIGCGDGRSRADGGGLRRDVGPPGELDADLDASGGGGLDAWLDPALDAHLDAFDPTAIDAWRPDANQDVGPVDAFAPDVGGGGGGVDTGVVVVRDGGPHDGGLDARVPTGTCGILWDRGDPLPDDCMPRCSRKTRDLFDGCSGDATCEATVMERDTVRAAQLYIWDDRDVSDIDCSSCIGTQRFSCWHDRCPTRSEGWVDCAAARGYEACERERLILERCLEPYSLSVASCIETRVSACFPE